MNQDKWTQQLHDKLAEREVAPPDDLWADIEAALPTSPEANQKSRARFVALRRWAIAASLALLVAGGGYLYWPSSSTPEATPATPTSTPIKRNGNITASSISNGLCTITVPITKVTSGQVGAEIQLRIVK